MPKYRFLPALCLATLAIAQSPRPEFEVATIKPSPGGDRKFIGTNGRDTFNGENLPLMAYIAEAYGVKSFQVYGAPGWISSEVYNVTGKTVAIREDPGKNQSTEAIMADLRLRLQTLLEDRCSLKTHRETKELPVYALTVAKSGLKLKPSDCVVFDRDNPPAAGTRPAYCGNLQGRRNGAISTLTGTGIPLTTLVRWLSTTTGRTVVDKTGYAENFNAVIEWTPDDLATTSETTGPSLFTALQEQLGLKLESAKGPVEVLVIDHVEKPAAN